jgi:hypothetical protein
LLTYANACQGTFEDQEKKDLRAYFEKEGSDAEKWGISESEFKALQSALA